MHCFFRYAAQHQSTVPDDALIPTFVDDRGLKLWILVCADRFPSFTQLGVDVDLVLFATHSDSNPAMHISRRGIGGI
jgi:hypothetical protein